MPTTATATPPTLSTRRSGVLLHPTSLPGPLGSGDIGPAAYRFVDDLVAAGQSWWQMLPVNPPSRPPGNSPYCSPSALAASPWLISPDLLHADGLLTKSDLPAHTSARRSTRADFPASIRARTTLLRKAHETFTARKLDLAPDFRAFREANAHWLPDYTLYAALKDKFDHQGWITWPAPLRSRNPKALAEARAELATEIAFHEFCQFTFAQQWRRLRTYANDRGVGLIGDLPIFVSHDSADVWAHPDHFLLDRTGHSTVVSGAPPDFFSTTGQKWGHPHYRWPTHQRTNFAWWVARFRQLFVYFDCVRIDHFLGFDRAWAVPAHAPDAVHGRWIKAPGDALFSALNAALGRPAIIVEDLGAPTKEALALRDRFQFPGMRVLHFGFGDDDYHLPHRYTPHAVAYTGTHDNDTTLGWFASLRAESNGQLEKATTYLGLPSHRAKPDPWPFIRAVATSVANTAIFPAQDLLALGPRHRMNLPGTCDHNWTWRLPDHLPQPTLQKLRQLTESTGRLPPPQMQDAHS